VAISDLTQQCLKLHTAENPAAAFAEWFEQQPEAIRVGFSGIVGPDIYKSASELFARRPQPALSQLHTLLHDGNWPAWVEEACQRADKLLGRVVDTIDIIVLIGFGARNASQGYWNERGLAFIWLEHFLPPGSSSGYLDLGIEQIPVWLGHEIAHAARYAVPESGSPVRDLMRDAAPDDFFAVLESLPLAERVIDEGLATAFSRAIAPDASDEDILYLSPYALEFLEQNQDALRRHRKASYDFSIDHPPHAALDDLFHFFADRCTGPWSLERPPTRWGYWWGDRVIKLAAPASWPDLLCAPAVRFPV